MEAPEVNMPSEQVESPQDFFEKLDPRDLSNVNEIRRLFEQTKQERRIAGFIGVVGSSALENPKKKPEDIDLLVGIETDLGNTKDLAPIGVYRRRFERWKETMHHVLVRLKEQGVVIEEVSVIPSHANENVAGNDGKFILTFPEGKKIELLCDQNPELHREAYEASLQPDAA